MLIPTSQNIKTVTDMREDALGMLSAVEKNSLIYVFQHSEPKAVMLSMQEFIRMRELIENLQDEKDALDLLKQKRGKLIPLEEIKKMYQD